MANTLISYSPLRWRNLKTICLVACLSMVFFLVTSNHFFFQKEVGKLRKEDPAKWRNIARNNVSKTGLHYMKLQDLSAPFRQGGRGLYQNLLDADPPVYLDNFRNPCWREELPSAHPYPEKAYFLRKRPVRGWFVSNSKMFYRRVMLGKPWRLRCLPYFYLAGFVKSGTTELFRNIGNHPMVAYSRKELHWWTRYRNCLKRSDDDDFDAVPVRDYIDLFDIAARKVQTFTTKENKQHYHPIIIGEGSTTTVCQQRCWWQHPENKGRQLGVDAPNYINAHYIHHVTPGAKIIISMRDPANRLYSQYTMHGSLGPEDFHRRVTAALHNMTSCIKEHDLFACTDIPSINRLKKFAVSDSLYYAHLVRWLRVFPRKQFYFIKLEDFKKDRVEGLNKIFEFLELEQLAADVLKKESYHVRIGCENCTVPLMLEKTRTLLNDFYAPYNAQLADLLHDKRWLFL